MDDSMMPLSENSKLPQVYKMEINEDGLEKEKNKKANGNAELIGLTKEQLEEFRNDPFWRVLRCVMFAMFWLLWLAMFGGAVVLVVLSPKCAIKKQPEWTHKHISYQIFTPSFRDTNGDGIGDFNGIKEKLNQLRKIGVDTVRVAPVIATQKDDFRTIDVMDFGSVDQNFGKEDDLKSLIDEVHSLDMHFTMDLPLTTTSEQHQWFKSSKKNEEYRDFYIWRKMETFLDSKDYAIEDGSGYACLTHDSKYPVLNWVNPRVRDSILNATKKFVDLGVDGFYVSYVSELMIQQPHSQRQAALATLNDFIGRLRSHAKESDALKGKNIEIFTDLDDIQQLRVIDAIDYKMGNLTYVVDNSATKLNSHSCTGGISKCLYALLIASLELFKRSELPHAWQFTNHEVSRLSSRFDAATSDLLTFVQLTLPGAAEIYYGQELSMQDIDNSPNKYTGLMLWDSSNYSGFTSAQIQPFFAAANNFKEINFETQLNAAKSSLKAFKKVAKLRRDHNLVLGEIQLEPLLEHTIMFSRFRRVNNQTDGAAYVIIANFGTKLSVIDVSKAVPEDRASNEAEIYATTANVGTFETRQKIKIATEKLTLLPKEGVILRV